MNSQKTKKLLAFIIIMMFFSLTQIANAQIHPDLGGGFPGDICNCKAKNYGCGTSSACYTHCSVACKPRQIKIIKFSRILIAGIGQKAILQLEPVSFLNSESGQYSLKLLATKENSIKPDVDSKIDLMEQMEWDGLKENIPTAISN